MSSLQIDSVLSQMRTLSAQMQIQNKVGMPGVAQTDAASSPFAAMMKQGIQQVNQAQHSANQLATAFERGVPGVELPQVMLEMQKASVSLRALTEVRNRFVNVYQDIMNMPI